MKISIRLRALYLVLICFAFNAAQSVYALQLQVYPGDPVYVHVANPNRGYVDLVIHNIVFVNNSAETVSLDNAVINVLQGERVMESRFLTTDEIQATTKDIADTKKQGMGVFFDLDFPWNRVLGEKITLADGSKLGPQQAAFAQKIFLTVSGMPTSVEIHALGKDSKGKFVEATTRLSVASGKSANEYHCPLQGTWYTRSVADVTSHHRWHAETEFALDFWKIGENDFIWKTDGTSPTDFYGFGAPVLATADGVVVTAVNDAVQDYVLYTRKPGESEDDYGGRLEKHNLEMMKSDLHISMGNYIVLQHAGGEYSAYAHLKTGSVTVKAGDHVTTGQQIAQIGDTGDTNLVHLHFQISDGPDPATARSIPFKFVDVKPTDPDLGRIVRVPQKP